METTELLCIPRRHEPAKIVEFMVGSGDTVTKMAPVLIYEYKEKASPNDDSIVEDTVLLKALKKSPDAQGYLTKREYLRSPFEGKVTALLCKMGDQVRFNDALVQITVPCSHSTVFNGLCTLCGKDVSQIDATGVPDTQAQISMFHNNSGLKVSYDVAASIDSETRERLWDQKKLSLIIDLDQTIIHANASEDPHFEAWLIENYDGPRDAQPNGDKTDGAEPDAAVHKTLPDDIGSFYLPVRPSRHFVKLRPGLRDFLESISKIYELHIYTMGSRPYADAVASVIDPQSRLFSGRVISRDESGSLEKKNLRRLFPVDTSMVVILDDRADVWDWSPNLIRVHQYQFFTGVGDINAGHLPPVQTTRAPDTSSAETISEAEKPLDGPSIADTNKDAAAEGANSEPVPLAAAADDDAANSDANPESPAAAPSEPVAALDSTGNHQIPFSDAVVHADVEYGVKSEEGKTFKQPRLVDNDRELIKVQDVLTQLHQDYYKHLGPSHEPPLPDVAQILSRIKSRVLGGVTIVFTAIFRINAGAIPPQQSDLWIWAQNFGARCELEVTDRTTHVVAGKPGTEKAHAARRMANKGKTNGGSSPIVVKEEWLLHSIYRWEWLDETPYLWHNEDKDLVASLAERRKPRQTQAGSPAHKRKSSDEDGVFDQGSDKKYQRRQPAAIERLKQQVDRATHEYDSANTTDIEDELERQEAGLQEHEAEVDNFVQNIDWDDLEREVMGDSESEDNLSSGDEQSKNASHSASVADLRQKALRRAVRRRIAHGNVDGSDDADDHTADGDASSSDGESNTTGSTGQSNQGKKRARISSSDSLNQHGKGRNANKRLSNLAAADGSLDISTNTEDEDNSGDTGSDTSVTVSKPKRSGENTRDFLASKMGISLKQKSILDEDPGNAGERSKPRDSDSDEDNDDDFYEGDPHDIDGPLFAGIEDEDGDYRQGNKNNDEDDEDELGDGSRNEGDESGSEQWGEDDESDEENFDDLINDLEEEISSSS